MLTLSNSSPSSSPLQTTIPLGWNYHAIIDIEDFASLSQYHWNLRKSHSCWYATRKETVHGIRRTIFMHRHIVGALPSEVVHHKNRNTLDNRRQNLLLLSPREHSREHANAMLRIVSQLTTGGTPQT